MAGKGGAWVEASSGDAFKNENPAKLGEVLGTFPSATKEDTRQAIEAARAALPGWSNMPGPARGAILDKASRVIEARADEFATVRSGGTAAWLTWVGPMTPEQRAARWMLTLH